MIIQAIFLTIIAYLVGSISTGVLLSRLFGQGNLQAEGSKSIGATNVSRLMGMKWGILTLLGDVLKGMLMIWIGRRIFGGEGDSGLLIISLMALAVFLGHIFPVFLGFKGGKGVATALGIFILLGPKAILVAVPVFVLVVLLGKYVSLGSIVAAGSFPVLMIVFSYPVYTVGLAIVIAAAIILKHKANIQRLIKGEEKPWRSKGKPS
ncbi:MAG: glycerol-3-phosphate 1-O-acyltransferase PlsY [Deltaproteobacteria bacterium]|nr:glycerol-3-phosphate 1-O-acyltransferase PlsY [Deltaproteobacteria bacterium]